MSAHRRRASDPTCIGAKNFSEQYILAELIGERLEARGRDDVERKDDLGSAIAYRALASGEIDVYVDYSGTLWTNVLERSDVPPREGAARARHAGWRERDGVLVLGSLGFENAYALAMRRERAAALGVTSSTTWRATRRSWLRQPTWSS